MYVMSSFLERAEADEGEERSGRPLESEYRISHHGVGTGVQVVRETRQRMEQGHSLVLLIIVIGPPYQRLRVVKRYFFQIHLKHTTKNG